MARWMHVVAAMVACAVAPCTLPGVVAAPAGQDVPAAQLPRRPLQEALDESISRGRLLIVVATPTRERERAARAVWSNPALQQWVRWHAVLVHVDDHDTIATLRSAGLIPGLADQPLVFRTGKQERLFGSLAKDDGGVGGVRLRGPPRGARADDDRPSTSIRLLMRLDWTLRALGRADAGWWEAHLRNNPRPDPPHVGFSFGALADARDESLGDPAPGGPWMHPCPLARLWRLLDPAAGGDAATRPDLLAWLWERGTQYAEPFDAVRLCSLAREWHRLGEADAAIAARARAIRDGEAALLPWMDHRGLFTWIMLSRVAGEHLESLDFLDAALDDPDAATMMSPDDRAAYEMMLPWLNWNDPATLPGAGGDGLVLLKGLSDRLARRRPARMTGEEWGRVLALGSWLMRVEGSRVYASLLARGADEEAKAAAALVQSAVGRVEAAEWLVTAALGERQGRPEQLALLDGVTTPWASRLKVLLAAELAKPPGK